MNHWSVRLFAAISSLLLSYTLVAEAQVIADPAAPGNQQPTILQAPNGTPLINIQTPGAGGVSRNTYRQFDVQQQGVILNNSRTAVQSQLGGWVQGNPWLNQGEARVILNEVSSNNPSYLRGYVEVAGRNAEVIIANPAGIQVDGGGFINASQATLTTGTPVLQGGNLEYYRVHGGTIRIIGKGLDTSQSDYTHLLARAIELNAGVWARNLQVVTGTNDVAHATGKVLQVRPSGAGQPAGSFALDVAHLGGMYAGKITLVGTEAGLGVRNAGHIGASAGQITLTSEGQLLNSGTLLAATHEATSGHVVIDTRDGITNDGGTLYAEGNTQLSTRGDIHNAHGGMIAAMGYVALQASGSSSRIQGDDDSTLVAGLLGSGQLDSASPPRHLSLEATQSINVAGQNLATGNITLRAGSLNLTDSQTSAQQITATALTGDARFTRAQLTASEHLQVQAQKTFHTNQADIIAPELLIQAYSLDNTEGSIIQTGKRNLELDLAGELTNISGYLATNSDVLTIQADSLNNTDGQIIATQLASFHTQQRLNNSAGQLTANHGLSLRAGELINHTGLIQSTAAGAVIQVDGLFDNSGQLQSREDLRIQVGKLDNSGNLYTSEGNLQLDVTSLATNSGLIAARQDIALSAQELLGSTGSTMVAGLLADGLLAESGSLELRIQEGLTHQGQLLAPDALYISATDIQLGPGQLHAENLELNATGQITLQQATLTAGQTLVVQAQEFRNQQGLLQAGDQATLTSQGDLVNQGHILAAGTMLLEAKNLENTANTASILSGDALHLNVHGQLINYGQIQSVEDLQFQGESLENRGADAAIISGSNLQLYTTAHLLNQGQLQTAGSLKLDASSVDNLGEDATISSGSTLDIRLQDRLTNQGRIHAVGDVHLDVQTFENAASALLISGSEVQVNIQEHLSNQGQIQAAGKLRLDAQSLDNQGADAAIVAGDTADIRLQQRLLNQGQILAANRMQVDARTFDNAVSALLAGGSNVQLNVGEQLLNHGQIQALDGVQLDARTFDNTATALLISSGDIRLTLQDSLTNRGQVQAVGDLQLDTQTLSNLGAAATLTSSGITSMQLGQTLMNQGQIQSAGELLLDARILENTADAQILSGSTLTLTIQQELANQGQLLSADDLQLEARIFDNAATALLASGGETRLTLQDSLTNRGKIQVVGNLQLETQELNNLGAAATLTTGGTTSIQLSQTLTNQGQILASGDLQLETHSLSNATSATLASGSEATFIIQHGLDNLGQLLASGDLLIQARALENTASGEIASGGRAQLSIHNGVVNQGQILAEEELHLTAEALDNQSSALLVGGGQVALAISQGLQNSGQLLTTSNLQLQAGTLINTTGAEITSGDSATVTISQGLQNSGQILAANSLQLQARTLNNAANAEIASGGSATLNIQQTLDNRGSLQALNTLYLHTHSLINRIEADITTNGNAQLEIQENLTNQGEIQAFGNLELNARTLLNDTNGKITAGNLSVTLQDKLTNHGTLLAASQLHIRARELDNSSQQSEIASGNKTTLEIEETLTNRGLIDGETTHLQASTLENIGTGRIYGNLLAIAANSLTNREETHGSVTTAGTIAARERLELGVQNLYNREQSLIFSGNHMNIGGALDAALNAIGESTQLHNASATIEALGNLRISVNTLRNTNEHFAIDRVQTMSDTPMVFIQPKNSIHKIPLEDLFWKSWSRAGEYRYKTDNYDDDGGILGATAIPRVGEQDCEGEDEATEVCWPIPGSEYPHDDPAWEYFQIAAPVAAPTPPAQPAEPNSAGQQACVEGAGYNAQACADYTLALAQYTADLQTYQSDLQDYLNAYATWAMETDERYEQLDARIETYNESFASHKIRSWTQYEVVRSEWEDQVVSSAPGQILSGGNMHLISSGSMVNDKSHIIAGGALAGELGRLENLDATGLRIISESGTSRDSWSNWRGGVKRYHERKWGSRVDYNPVDEIQTITLPVTRQQANANDNGTGYQAGGITTVDITPGNLVAPGRNIDITPVGTVAAQPGWEGLSQVHVNDPGRPDLEAIGHDSLQSNPTDINLTGIDRPAPQAIQGLSGPGTQLQVRTTPPNITPPSASLYRQQPDPSASYLIETDPRFASYQDWLGSDYMLEKLKVDGDQTLKRLGDGFYEQRLIREQITQLTGSSFLGNHSNEQAQYQALMNAGVAFAQEHQLIPGVALSAAQMAQLTSDIVWLVEQQVTLSDGSMQSVLVPQVYALVREGDLDGSGALLAGHSVNLNIEGDLINSASLAGRTSVTIDASSIQNLGGQIQGDDLSLSALEDIHNLGGQIRADNSMNLSAGRDIIIESTTYSGLNEVGRSSFSRTDIDRIAGLYLGSNATGGMNLSAGNDLTLVAAQLINNSDSITQLKAGQDIHLETLQVSYAENSILNSNNRLQQSSLQDIGTQISTQGDILLHAGQDISLQAASVNTAQGDLTGIAGGDIYISAGQYSQSYEEARQHTHSGTVQNRTRSSLNAFESTSAIGSSLDAANITLIAGQDLTITASSLVADHNVTLAALEGDVSLLAGENTYSTSNLRGEKRSGLLSGGLSLTLGSQALTQAQTSQHTSAAGNTIGSLNGDINIQAGGQYIQVGSDLIALDGDISVLAQSIAISEARETSETTQETRFKQSGLTLALSSPIIDAAQTGQQMYQASQNTSSDRMQALAAGAVALNLHNNADKLSEAGQALASGDVGNAISLSLSVGSSRSNSSMTRTSDTAKGSSLTSGGDISLIASGAGEDSNLLIQGSHIQAGNNTLLFADNAIDLLAAANHASQESDSKSSSASIGIGISLGSDGFRGGITVSASAARGNTDGEDQYYSNSHVSAGNQLHIHSGGDTNLVGGVASANQVLADIGGVLTIESLQDTSRYDSKSQSAGGSVTFGPAGGVSANYGQGNIDASYASVNEQSGIQAGDGGFQINVVGDTSLIGGVIGSTQEAVESGVNQFETGGELHTSDIQNHMQYSAKSISVGTGGAGYGSESASQQSTSQAGISGVAGNAEVRSGDAGSGLANTFDASKVQKELDAHAAITAQFGQQASTAWGDYANQQFLDAVTHGDEQSATCWAPDGSCRAAGHMLVGGATGGLDGALGAGFSSVSAPHVQAFFIKQGLPAEAAAALTELTALGAGALLGDGEGAVAGYNEASNNAVQFMMPAGGPVAAKMCLSSPACVKAVIMVGGAVAVEAMVLLLPEDELGQMQVPGFGEGLSPQETWSTILLMADVYESLRLGLGGKPATNAEDVSGTPGYGVQDASLGDLSSPLAGDQGLGNVYSENRQESGSGMLGQHGTQIGGSITLWHGNGKERIDVENPNPGQRPGQIHYQDNKGNKYMYDHVTNSFPDAPRSVNKLLHNPDFVRAIEKGLHKYLGE